MNTSIHMLLLEMHMATGLIMTVVAAIGSALPLHCQAQGPLLPAIYVFGDSTVDSGNNNDLHFTVVRANHQPYGIDFPNQKATGRFSNGYVPTDFIAERLGLPLPPPFFDNTTSPSQYIQGANFASGGSGALSTTAITMGVRSLENQVDAFRGDFRDRLVAEVGEAKAASTIREAIYVLSTGTNDYLNTYLNDPVVQYLISPEQFQDVMVRGMVSFLEAIHNAGGRRMATLSLILLGCLPSQKLNKAGLSSESKADLDASECVQSVNEFAQGFNAKMESAVGALQARFTDSIIRFAEVFELFGAMVAHPEDYEMAHRGEPCCGDGAPLEAGIGCNSASSLCSDASQHVFWDSFHPSHQSYKVISEFLWNEYSADFVAPLPTS